MNPSERERISRELDRADAAVTARGAMLADILVMVADVFEEDPDVTLELSDAEARFIAEHGGVAPALAARPSDESVVSRRVRGAAEDVRDSFDVEQVAASLRIDRTQVQHRVAKDQLYSFKLRGRRRFPSWQFTVDTDRRLTPIPALRQVVQAVPRDMHPAAVQGLMLTPQDELDVDGSPTAPAEWLVTGGAVEPVLELLRVPMAW